MLVYTAYTIWSMPYASLGMELTKNYDERTHITAWAALIGVPVGLVGAWAHYFISGDWFADPVTGEPDLVTGARVGSWVLGGIFVVVALLPGLFVKERYKSVRQEKIPLWSSFRESVKSGPIWALSGIIIFNLMGLGAIGSLGYYINIYMINVGEIGEASKIEGWKQTGMVLLTFVSIPFWTWVCSKTDKKFALYIVLVATMFGHSLNYFCLTPKYPYLQVIPAFFYAAISAAIWLIVPSMRMDVADHDELRTGKRREGSLAAVFSWCVKMGGTLTIGLGGWVLTQTGFDANLKVQPPEVIDRMYWTFLLAPYAFWLVSLTCLVFFPLDRKAMNEIRAKLAARKAEEATD